MMATLKGTENAWPWKSLLVQMTYLFVQIIIFSAGNLSMSNDGFMQVNSGAGPQTKYPLTREVSSLIIIA